MIRYIDPFPVRAIYKGSIRCPLQDVRTYRGDYQAYRNSRADYQLAPDGDRADTGKSAGDTISVH